MYRVIFRIIMLIVALYFATVFYSKAQFTEMWIMIVSAGFVVISQIYNTTVRRAYRELRRNNVPKANALLASIKNPDKLKGYNKAYYHFTKGYIALNQEQFKDGLKEFTLALETGLKSPNDKCAANLNLTAIELNLKHYSEAAMYLDRARQFKYKAHFEEDFQRYQEILDKKGVKA